jgi:YHS domain-containing protein
VAQFGSALHLGCRGRRFNSSRPDQSNLLLIPLLAVNLSYGQRDSRSPNPWKFHVDGRELRFSSKKSLETFLETPEPFLEKIDALMVADQLALYPLNVCPISGEKLGSMGDPKEIIYKNRLVRLCCNGCLKKFRKDPSKSIAELNDAVIKVQIRDYPLETCVISDEELGAVSSTSINGARIECPGSSTASPVLAPRLQYDMPSCPQEHSCFVPHQPCSLGPYHP